jgi:hypothetical protein
MHPLIAYFLVVVAVIVGVFVVFLIFFNPDIQACEAAGGTWLQSKCVDVKEIKV